MAALAAFESFRFLELVVDDVKLWHARSGRSNGLLAHHAFGPRVLCCVPPQCRSRKPCLPNLATCSEAGDETPWPRLQTRAGYGWGRLHRRGGSLEWPRADSGFVRILSLGSSITRTESSDLRFELDLQHQPLKWPPAFHFFDFMTKDSEFHSSGWVDVRSRRNACGGDARSPFIYDAKRPYGRPLERPRFRWIWSLIKIPEIRSIVEPHASQLIIGEREDVLPGEIQPDGFPSLNNVDIKLMVFFNFSRFYRQEWCRGQRPCRDPKLAGQERDTTIGRVLRVGFKGLTQVDPVWEIHEDFQGFWCVNTADAHNEHCADQSELRPPLERSPAAQYHQSSSSKLSSPAVWRSFTSASVGVFRTIAQQVELGVRQLPGHGIRGTALQVFADVHALKHVNNAIPCPRMVRRRHVSRTSMVAQEDLPPTMCLVLELLACVPPQCRSRKPCLPNLAIGSEAGAETPWPRLRTRAGF